MNDTGPARSAGATRSPDEIERDLEQARRRLAGTIDQLADRVSPKAVAQRSADKAKLQVIDASGAPRTNRIVAIGAAVVGWIALTVWRRRR